MMQVLLDRARELELEPVLEEFREQGFARLGPVVREECLAALRQRSRALMLGERTIPGLFFQHDSATGRYADLEYGKGYVGPSLSYRKLERLEEDDLFRALLENALFERIARRVIGEQIVLYRATLFNKDAHGSSELPWHQDGGNFWGLDREPTLQIWTAIDDCGPRAGCLRIVPGSHKDGLASPLGGLVQREILEAGDAEARAVMVPARAGEVVLIHNHAWHCSGSNTSGQQRRAFTACYMDAATRCLRKKRAPRVFVRVFEGAARSARYE